MEIGMETHSLFEVETLLGRVRWGCCVACRLAAYPHPSVGSAGSDGSGFGERTGYMLLHDEDAARRIWEL
ncbi:hypothetical protein ACLOJK_025320 [Asimina triloba]